MKRKVNTIRTLIADDDSSGIVLLQEYCEELCPFFQVTPVTDGLQAVKLFSKRKFDLVILDIRLPLLSGLEVLRKIRTTVPDITALAYTAYGIPTEIHRYYKAGFNEVLVKPLDFDTFSKAINKYFNS